MSSKEQVSDGASGIVNPFAPASDFDTHSFVIRQALAKVRTTTIVKVIDCSNDGGLSPVGFVDLQVLVGRMDGDGNVIDAGTIYDVPYFRLQGGANAIVMDPQKGDIGLACISDRDISSVKASREAAAPGSVRRHDIADALYIGGILNGAPTQYIQFGADGVNIFSPTMVRIEAPEVDVRGAVTVTGSLDIIGPVTASETVVAQGDVIGQGISLATHVQTGVTPGSGTSGPPA